jgi:chemotaxis protein CheD
LLWFPVGKHFEKVWFAMPQKSATYEQLERIPTISSNTNTHPQLEEVRVDMAGMKVDSRPVELLTSVGSCVGICVYDSIHRCGGLAHIMLPHSNLGPQEPLPSKFADTAVPALLTGIRGLTGITSTETRLTAKIAGGANMFANTGANGLDIGTKNVTAVKKALDEHKIRVIGEDVGGNHGRRINFNLASGAITIKLHSGEIRKL